MTAENRKIRWGVLGCARIARENVIPAILRSANSELYAVASREASKLADCRARFPGAKTCHGYEELLRDPAVDAVYIPLPNALHCEWTLKAAEHGRHVLCEKPLALTAAEGGRMIAACAAHGVLLMEAFMYRYTDRTRQVLEVLRSGALGDLKFIGSTFRFLLSNPASIKLQPALGGGALYDVGCYAVNFTGLVVDEILRSQSRPAADSLPEAVSTQWERAGGVDLQVSALLKYPGGLIAALHAGFNAQKRVFAEIIGTRGALEIPDTFFNDAGALTLTTGDIRREIPVAASDRYRLEVEDFADAILHHRAPHLAPAETRRNLEVMDRIIAAG